MTEPQADFTLSITPFLRGVHYRDRVIIRGLNHFHFLSLSEAELEACEELSREPLTVTQFVEKHLAGRGKINFKEAIELLIKLHRAHFLTADAWLAYERHPELLPVQHLRATEFVQAKLEQLRNIIDVPIVHFPQTSANRYLRFVGKFCTSWLGFALICLASVALGILMRLPVSHIPRSLVAQLVDPLTLIMNVSLVFSLCYSILSLADLLILSGTGVGRTPALIRLTGFCILRLDANTEEAFLLPKSLMVRYRLISLVMPWFLAALAWYPASHGLRADHLSLPTTAFALCGILRLCPLYRSPLVLLAEGILARLNLIEVVNTYLKGLVKGLIRWKRDPRHSFDWTVTLFACASMLWLYFGMKIFADALIGGFPALWKHLSAQDALGQKFAAGMILFLLGMGLIILTLKLILVPLQNIAEVMSIPIRKARLGVDQFRREHLHATDAIKAFLKNIPLFSALTDDEIMGLIRKLRHASFSKGETIIEQGERGDEFFILGSGEAQVIVKPPNEVPEVVDVLRPGDSFGEIALIERTPRTATVRALTAVQTFVLDRESFESLFPENNHKRKQLTTVIRRAKLVLESQAFSHLTPSQIHEFLSSVEPVTFPPKAEIVRQGEIGETAFLINSGSAGVYHEPEGTRVAELKRGDVLGAISVIKHIPRTATVRAETEVSCLKITKGMFLKICMSNVLVGMLIADLADKQMAELKSKNLVR